MINMCLRTFLGIFVFVVVITLLMFLFVVLLPFKRLRIRVANEVGAALALFVVWLLNVKIQSENKPLPEQEPCIFVGNHTSTLDLFLQLILGVKRNLTIAKWELIFVPFLGLAYYLSGHGIINRQNRKSAIKSMNKVATYSKKYRYSLWIWPEGTRSRDGRLQPFKKGFAHFALQTGFPVVPVVIHHAYEKWSKGKMFNLHRFVLRVYYADPIPTTDWKLETLNEHVESVRQVFIEHLEESQRPLT